MRGGENREEAISVGLTTVRRDRCCDAKKCAEYGYRISARPPPVRTTGIEKIVAPSLAVAKRWPFFCPPPRRAASKKSRLFPTSVITRNVPGERERKGKQYISERTGLGRRRSKQTG